MKPVKQRITEPGRGDCMAACIASLLELPLEAVPNLSDLPRWNWITIFIDFMYRFGWEFDGIGNSSSLAECEDKGIEGYYIAGVPSLNFEDCEHAILINKHGVCVHDPSTKKTYDGVNVILTGDLIDYYSFVRRTDSEWLELLDTLD